CDPAKLCTAAPLLTPLNLERLVFDTPVKPMTYIGSCLTLGKESAAMFTGVKVFSATKAKEREELGENVTRWLKSNSDLEVVDRVVPQSSDNEFDCYTLVLFFREKSKA